MESNIRKWLDRCRSKYRSRGLWGLLRQLYWVYVGVYLTVTSRFAVGTNVYEREWDMLIILDACRVDAMKAVADEYSFIESVDTHDSLASTSGVWMAQTFTQDYIDEINDTTYVTANVWTRKVLDWRELPPVWHDQTPLSAPKWDTVEVSELDRYDYAWEYAEHSGSGGFPPRPVTDRTIQLCRERMSRRTIVHYMQPHSPYIAVDEPVVQKYHSGELTKEDTWDAYLENLRYVLDDVELLLKNVDAEKVVITADHGEAYDDWGFNGHNIGSPVPTVRTVPWVETTASDEKLYEPDHRKRKPWDEEEIEEGLEHLGYKTYVTSQTSRESAA